MSKTRPETLTTVASAPATPENVTIFGKYELGRVLGSGGFAKVYHARTCMGHSVAVKAISKAKVEKNGLMTQVKREISVMQRLRHPNIIRIKEVLANKSRVFVVMEFAKGGELFAKVAKGRFSEDLSRRYFHQLISAVGYCHSRGVYHRDLKPENLLLDENWNLQITDFGLSAVKDEGRNSTDGMLHTLCGTPAYVAPEVLAKKGYFGNKIDVWSCGIILYVLNAGYLPFNDTNIMSLYKKIYKGQFRCPRWMSNELKHLLGRLLDVNPDTRINIEEITSDPWFKKGYKEINLRFYDDDWMKKDLISEVNEDGNSRFLNAFDLISFSPGFNLSGLFIGGKEEIYRETFLSTETDEKVVEGVAKAMGELDSPKVAVERLKGTTAVRLEGQNGNFALVVNVHRLTGALVMVEVRWREKVTGSGRVYWKEKLRPKICHLMHHSEQIESQTIQSSSSSEL